ASSQAQSVKIALSVYVAPEEGSYDLVELVESSCGSSDSGDKLFSPIRNSSDPACTVNALSYSIKQTGASYLVVHHPI
ncbi:MAG: hypothetical protein OEZ23_10190, partial [Gammaproteobacteria bacterium]|nr:hypothetical protein [Gammaproteobacteria bacterium]